MSSCTCVTCLRTLTITKTSNCETIKHLFDLHFVNHLKAKHAKMTNKAKNVCFEYQISVEHDEKMEIGVNWLGS